MHKLKDKYNIIYIIMIIVAMTILGQLTNLQILNGAKYEEESQQRLLRNRRIIAPRGNIMDRNGVPIAINRLSYSVGVTKTIQTNDELNKMLLDIVNILEGNGDSYEDGLSNYLAINPISYGRYLKDSKAAQLKWKNDLTSNKKDLVMKLKTPEDVFNFLRIDKFNISKSYSIEDAYKIMVMRYEILIKGYSMLNSLTIAKDVSKASVVKIEEMHHLYPGISTNIEPMREYTNVEPVAHVIGYLANINSEEYQKNKDNGYYMTDYIGKMGIEKAFEKELRGVDGQLSLETDIWYKKSNYIKENPAIPGNDVTLTIDMNMQTAAMNSLKKNIDEIRISGKGRDNYRDTYFGSAVAVDINTGELLVMASYPSFDPSIFTENQKKPEVQKAITALYDPENKTTSQFNRAISGIYPPGSTYKPLIGLAGLEEGVIDKNTVIYDSGVHKVEGVTLTCLEWRLGMGAHHNITLKDGLKTSCNIFFYKLGIMLGIDKIDQWAKMFGFGEYEDIEIEGESRGIRSNPDYHEKLYNYKFGKVMTAYSAIGQGYNLYTPLQMANYVSTIANGGKKYKLHLLKNISNSAGKIIKETEPEYKDLNLNKKNLETVKEGMLAVTSEIEGTAVDTFKDFPHKVAAKTGTAQKGERNHSDYALFIAFAPADDPKIALCVVLERGVFGSYAAPVARDILDEYFKFKNDDTKNEEIKMLNEYKFTR